MPIQALPNATVRILGASQALNDPATVVKELLDNALDARATSIAIEISCNTVDSIQVRDNGHGVPPEDRDALAKPHHTSKISEEGDLKSIGGISLGFRGEALASIAELSETLAISTRVEGEQVAVTLKKDQLGNTVGQDRISLPVGTTVKITGFVKAYPVRNQTALRTSEKCLKKIKRMLQEYAFARPHVRFSLGVLKGSNKTGWTYAPKPDGGVEDAALKIVGGPCTSQCTLTTMEDRGFTLIAMIPRPGAEVSKINNHGAFLSVDKRPLSTMRGTPKQIIKIFREEMKRVHAASDRITDPFVYLDIACPSASYDANVEPAKDDVVFEEPTLVLQLVRQLAGRVYPAQLSPRLAVAASGATTMLPQHCKDTNRSPRDRTMVEQSVAKPQSTMVEPRTVEHHPGDGFRQLVNDWDDGHDSHQESTSRQAFRPNMYGCDEEDIDLMDARPPTGQSERDAAEQREARRDINLSNPWVMAKMRAATKRYEPQSDDVGAQDADDIELPGQLRADPRRAHTDRPTGLLTPRPSSPLLPQYQMRINEHRSSLPHGYDARAIGAHSLPLPEMILPSSSISVRDEAENVFIGGSYSQTPAQTSHPSSQHLESSSGTPLDAIPQQRPRTKPRGQPKPTSVNKPFVSPLVNQSPREKVWFDHLANSGTAGNQYAKKREHQQHRDNGLIVQGELGELLEDPHPLTPPRRNRDMRDYVARLNHPEQDDAADLVDLADEPRTKRRQGASIEHESHHGSFAASENIELPKKTRRSSENRMMREMSGNARDFNEVIRPRTSNRAGPMRRRTSEKKVRRTKSSLLPLERVPNGQGTHRLIVKKELDRSQLLALCNSIDLRSSACRLSEDGTDAHNTFASGRSHAETTVVADKLKELLINRVSDREMVQDLSILLHHAFKAHMETQAVMSP